MPKAIYMIYTNAHLQALYSGFCKTAPLWKGRVIRHLHQLNIENYGTYFQLGIERRLRLGQLAERFVFNQLNTATDYSMIAENLQIQNGNITVGELDALIRHKIQIIHLEIIYKFYLYDATLGNSEIEKWISPNQCDRLLEKLDKLSQKQLPLLYSEYCQPVLQAHGISCSQIDQRVLFKAQLFTPFKTEVPFERLNRDAIEGFYITLKQLQHFANCQFYIPQKIDWILKVHPQVEWLNFDHFKLKAHTILATKKAPMIWIKTANRKFLKGFLIWW